MARELAASLSIRFADGERPHLFWVSSWTDGPDPAARYKVLSKQRGDASIEVLVVEETKLGGRRCLARQDIPAAAPAGWLAHWVSELGDSLGIRLYRYDLRAVETEREWRETAQRLGWTLL